MGIAKNKHPMVMHWMVKLDTTAGGAASALKRLPAYQRGAGRLPTMGLTRGVSIADEIESASKLYAAADSVILPNSA